MPYTQPWQENVPAGTDPANEIDVYIQNDKIATAERIADILGIADFTDDPLVPTTLKGNRTTVFTILGGTTSFAIRNSADTVNNVLVADAGTVTLRSHLLSLTDNTVDIGASGASRFRRLYLGTELLVPLVTATTGTFTNVSGAGSSITALNASNLSSGTIPDARFPSTLPVLDGSNLTNLNASNLASGTIPSARVVTLQNLAAHILFPSDNTYDIGAAGATRPRNLYVANNVTIGGSLTAGAVSFTGTNFIGHVTFTPDNTYDIGQSGALRPRTLYIGTSIIVPTVTATTVTGTTGTFTNVGGTLTTAAQPNITSVGVLATATITTLTTATVNATTLNGTIGTAAQPNITSLGTLAANLLFIDNTYDIGASGATRPRNLYVGTSITTGTSYRLGSVTLADFTSTNTQFYDRAGRIALYLGGSNNTNFYDNTTHTFRTQNGGSSLVSISTSGFLFSSDNTYDIGASGATRPRNLYVAGTGTFGGNLIGGTYNGQTINSAASLTGSLALAGNLSSTATGEIVTMSAASTGVKYFNIANTSGAFLLGVDSASGNGLATGATAYSTVLTTNNATDLVLATNGAKRYKISSAGAHEITGAVTMSSTLGVTGITTLSDTLNARAISFTTDNTYDIGASGANRPKDIYVAGNVYSGT